MRIPSRKGEEGAEKDQAKQVTSSFLPQQVLCPQEKIILEIGRKTCSAEEQGGWVSGCGQPRGLPGGRFPVGTNTRLPRRDLGLPLLLVGALRFFRRAAGTSGPPEQREPLHAGEPSGTFLSLVREREEGGAACRGWVRRGGSRQPAVCPTSTRAPGPSWSQRTSSHSSEEHGTLTTARPPPKLV